MKTLIKLGRCPGCLSQLDTHAHSYNKPGNIQTSEIADPLRSETADFWRSVMLYFHLKLSLWHRDQLKNIQHNIRNGLACVGPEGNIQPAAFRKSDQGFLCPLIESMEPEDLRRIC